MRLATVFSFLAVAAATVGAVPSHETNASRLARGLPPLPPVRRTPTKGGNNPKPSQVPGGQCNVEKVQCCNSVTHANDKTASLIISLLGLVVPQSTAVGLNCSPLSILGVGGNSCNAQPVCCENNNFNGLIAIGCSPININA